MTIWSSASLISPFLRRCISLGLLESRTQTRPRPRFLRRLAELLWLAFRPRINCLYHVRACRSNVLAVPSELCYSTLAYLRDTSFDHLDLYCGDYILQQVPTISTTVWTIRCARGRSHNHNCHCGYAKNACFKRFCLVGLGE